MCSVLQVVVKVIILHSFLLVSSSTCNSNHTRLPRSNSCTLPQHPQFGRWTIYDASTQLSPGKSVPERTILEISCNKKYRLDGDDFTTCIRGTWKPEIGHCLQTCPTISNTLAMTVTCSRNFQTLKSCANVFDNTMARFHCARYFEFQTLEAGPVRLCSNGNWVGSLPTCVPICGQPSPVVDPTLIVGGTEAERGKYPWQIALYDAKSKILLCGGTLLNQRVVLTAAHCITDGKAQLAPKENYIVAAGKYFLRYDHPDDANNTQFSSVLEMFIPVRYKGHARQYADDIAIIITTQIFDLSINVRPICVIWEMSRYKELLDSTKTKRAYVSGWGYTREFTGRPDVLKELEVPLISDQQCIEGLPEDDTEYVTGDKFCAGFLNSSTSVCKGDSGGGLVTKRDKRYYIIGIVSLSPRGNTQHGGCNSQLYTLYTKFSSHIDFVLENEAKFRPRFDCPVISDCNNITLTTEAPPTTIATVTNSSNGSGCILPNHPEFGKWSVPGSKTLQLGVLVATGTRLNVQCDKHFKREGPRMISCRNSKWSRVPKCLKVCPAIVSTPIMQVKCTYKSKERENCTGAVEGTLAKFRCADFYEDVQLKSRPPQICVNGKWSQQNPQCVPAASCVTDSKGNLGSKEHYVVAVGKDYKQFNDDRDVGAQSSQVHDIFISSEYNRDSGDSDIAILVTEKTFILRKNVVPVCLDVGQNHKPPKNQPVYITSWDRRNRNSSSDLKEENSRSLSHSECRNCMHKDFHFFLTPDKLCVPCLSNEGRCFYNPGSAVVYQHDGKYYVTGVVNSEFVNLDSNQCDIEDFMLYTDISRYMNSFILTKLSTHKT